MYQQPLTQAVSTKEFFRSLNTLAEDDRKLTARDVFMMVAEVVVVLALCWVLHVVVS